MPEPLVAARRGTRGFDRRLHRAGDPTARNHLTAEKHLPQKLFVVHQFRLSMIAHEQQLRTDYDNVALLIHMDGQGTPASKDATWRSVVAAAPKGVPFGWKNFTKQDRPMLTPEQTMQRSPAPMMISYQ